MTRSTLPPLRRPVAETAPGDGRIFISYAHRDEEFVFRLARDLEARGAQVWIDRGDIRGGARWRQSIADGVRNCRAFLLVVSPEALASPFVTEEVSQALAQRKPIFPLLYGRADLRRFLDGQLERYQYLDFRRGGYAQNLADLVAGLLAVGVPLHEAPEATPEHLQVRRDQLLGEPVRPQWGQVFARIPGWALAWGIGWAIFWVAIALFALVTGGDVEQPWFLPVGGFVGGVAGGLVAGLFTMLALRHHAGSIAWKHMAASIRIWGLVGPLGAIAAGALAFVVFNPETVNALTGLDCSELGFGECVGQIIGGAIASALAAAFLLLLLILLYVAVALLLIGTVAGWLAVRHIRRLEPGILGRQAIWVILGWGGGAIVATVVSLVVVGLVSE